MPTLALRPHPGWAVSWCTLGTCGGLGGHQPNLCKDYLLSRLHRTGRGRIKPRQAALGQDIPGGLGVFGQPHKSTTRPSAALTKGTWGLRPQRLLHELPRPSRDVDICPYGPGCSICASRGLPRAASTAWRILQRLSRSRKSTRCLDLPPHASSLSISDAA